MTPKQTTKSTPLTRKFPHIDIAALSSEITSSKPKLLEYAKAQFLESDSWSRIKEIQNETKHLNFREVEGDLFETDANAIAHCVSVDLAMGKGIAVEFVKRFGREDELADQKPNTGGVVYLERENEDVMRVIFYMITKEKYWHIPAYEAVWQSLLQMRELCEKLGVESLGMPVIACGLDCLQWGTVKEMIQAAFWDAKMDVTIYVHKPKEVQRRDRKR